MMTGERTRVGELECGWNERIESGSQSRGISIIDGNHRLAQAAIDMLGKWTRHSIRVSIQGLPAVVVKQMGRWPTTAQIRLERGCKGSGAMMMKGWEARSDGQRLGFSPPVT